MAISIKEMMAARKALAAAKEQSAGNLEPSLEPVQAQAVKGVDTIQAEAASVASNSQSSIEPSSPSSPVSNEEQKAKPANSNLALLLAAKAKATQSVQAKKEEIQTELSAKQEQAKPKESIQDKLAALKAKIAAKALASEQVVTEQVANSLVAMAAQIQQDEQSVQEDTTTIHDVIEIAGKYYTLAELLGEIAKLEKLTAKVKIKSMEDRLATFRWKASELEELISSKIYKEHVTKEADPSVIEKAIKETFSLDIDLNEQQLLASELAMAGKSFCLIGPAGSGKTTAQRAVGKALLDQGRLKPCSFKASGSKDRLHGLSLAAVAFTRRASANLQKAIFKDPSLQKAFQYSVRTIHSLLEFEPVQFFDEEKNRMSMRFVPQKGLTDKLDITHLVIEEASMVGLDLWYQLYDALNENVQIIFIGDINQLPPVFGPSILNYALVQLPVVELTQVYRQREGSEVLDAAHSILRGETPIFGNKCSLIEGKSPTQVGQEKMSIALSTMFKQWEASGFYDPEEDIILSPWNKQALGTENLNKWVAQFLGEKRKAIVHEIIAGFNKLYLAVGDKVMYEKMDGVVVRIVDNLDYVGTRPQPASTALSRFGYMAFGKEAEDYVDILDDTAEAATSAELDKILLNYENFDIDSLQTERKMQSSHIVVLAMDSGEEVTLSGAGDFGPASFTMGYVLTVHKAQGCEFRKVFGILHKDHGSMLFRELIYTLATRARDELHIIAKSWVLSKGITNQRIKGNTIKEKIDFFNKGLLDKQPEREVLCTI